MSDKNFKTLRKQLTNVVKQALPDVFSQELAKEIEEKLNKRLDAGLEALSVEIRQVLERVDQRSKDIQSYLVRSSTSTAPVPAPDHMESIPGSESAQIDDATSSSPPPPAA